MTNAQIEARMSKHVWIERQNVTVVLNLINLAEERDIPLARGFASTFEWLTKKHMYSSSAAFRRLSSARLMREVPAARQMLVRGEINLTTLSKAQSSIRTAERIAGDRLTPERKAEVVAAIAGQSLPEAEKTLHRLLPETAHGTPAETTRLLNSDFTRLSINFPNAALPDLEWAIDFLSHVVPDAARGRVLAKAVILFRRQAEKSSSMKAQRRQCEYEDPETGRRCENTFMVEEDHVVPTAMGGADEESNWRCLCRAHNQMMAREWLGRQWATSWQRARDQRRSEPGGSTG